MIESSKPHFKERQMAPEMTTRVIEHYAVCCVKVHMKSRHKTNVGNYPLKD